MELVERLGIGLLAGVLGALTGLLAWWCIADLPGLGFPLSDYLKISAVLGAVFLVAGACWPTGTLEVLGSAWTLIQRLGDSVASWLRLLK
jgi:hypothetical protein